jgi:large subunit ribosomal protein L15
VKILGVGELTTGLTFQVAGVSKSAAEAIARAGGSVTVIGAEAAAEATA